MRRTRRCAPIKSDVMIVGVDVAKAHHVAVMVMGDGRSTKAVKYLVNVEGFEQLLADAKKAAKRFGATSFVFALEPTGHYGTTLVHWLQNRGYEVYSVQPSHTNKAKSLYDGTTRKTDAKDALVIAELCRQGLCRLYRLPRGPYAEVRVLSHQREQLVKRRTQTRNRLHRHLDVVFPELPSLFRKLEGRACMWILETHPTPQDVLASTIEELTAGLRAASRSQVGKERAEALHAAAKASIGITEGLESHRVAIAQLVAELKHIVAQIRVLEKQMADVLASVPYAGVLATIPRLGVVTTATLLGEFGDLRNYQVARQLIAMAGLDLVENSSGKRQGHHQISRRGSAYARQMLYLAALRVGWGFLAEPRRRQVEDRKKSAAKAAVANMARLLRVMHAIARDGKPFDASRFQPTYIAEAA